VAGWRGAGEILTIPGAADPLTTGEVDDKLRRLAHRVLGESAASHALPRPREIEHHGNLAPLWVALSARADRPDVATH
jgi:hypothetical protein